MIFPHWDFAPQSRVSRLSIRHARKSYPRIRCTLTAKRIIIAGQLAAVGLVTWLMLESARSYGGRLAFYLLGSALLLTAALGLFFLRKMPSAQK